MLPPLVAAGMLGFSGSAQGKPMDVVLRKRWLCIEFLGGRTLREGISSCKRAEVN